MSTTLPPTGPDLALGLKFASLTEGTILAGHVGEEAVILVRRGDSCFAIGAACSHYGAPLADGIVVGDTVRCPWHHACFDIRSGEALAAPAMKPVARWEVEQRDGMVYVSRPEAPTLIGIVGAGAAGNAAAEMLRRLGYAGAITMIGADPEVPYDRPNLSKDYLTGEAPEEWMPLRPRAFYDDHHITLLTGRRVTALDRGTRTLTLDDGTTLACDRVLLATGADPVPLDVPGAKRAHVRYLRSLADSRAIIAIAETAHRVVVIGASFIGLEVAASLRARGLAVEVVAPESRPLATILGPELGDLVRTIHEAHGVVFHLEQTVTAIGDDSVTLRDGTVLPADLVVIGIGVRPDLALAEGAGLTMDRGVAVDEFLETSAPGVFAAGDIARWPDPHSGERIRVEHWVVAQRQGQVAARNLLDPIAGPHRAPFDAVPFFWSQHYDLSIRYVGHAAKWDSIVIDGDVAQKDATVSYLSKTGAVLAVATVGRDRASLKAEAKMEGATIAHQVPALATTERRHL